MASANQYEITIVNESGSSQSYLLFVEVPQVSGPGKVFQNVFMTAPTIVSRPNGSSSTYFSITRQFYGICGTSIQNLAAGVTVSTSDYEAVTLGMDSQPGTTLNFTTTQGANFTLPIGTPTGPAGGYTIQTDDSFVIPDPNNTFIGLGGMNMQGKVVPVATFLAAPSQIYNLFPVVRYYIATGTYTAGQILNVQQIGVTQLVDFTNSTYSSMTYVHNNKGQYVFQPPNVAKKYKLARLQTDKVAMLGADNVTPIPGLTSPETYTNGQLGTSLRKEDQLARDMIHAFYKLLRNAEADM